MHNAIARQVITQHQNNPQNLQKMASPSAVGQMFKSTGSPATSNMNQAAILSTLMQLIQSLISSLLNPTGEKKETTGQEVKEQGNTNASSKKKGEKNVGTSPAGSNKAGSATAENNNSPKSSTGNSTQQNATNGQTTTGKVYSDDSGASDSETKANNSGTPQSLAGSLARKTTTDFDAKFNIPQDLRDCDGCINEFSETLTATGDNIRPYSDPTDFDQNPIGQDVDRKWKEDGNDNRFHHSFKLGQLDSGEHYKSGYLEVEVSRPSSASPLIDNDEILINDDNATIIGTTPISWQPGETSKTIKIPLNAAQLKSAEDGDFSWFIQDDTTVNKAKLHLEGGTTITPQNGTDSDDTLNGKSQTPDIIHGLKGDDIIDGKSGDDCLYGDEGDDHVKGGSGNDKVFGGEGDDKLEGGSGDDNVFGGEGDDIVRGGSGDDVIFGDAGEDDLSGGDGNDKIYALDGNDKVKGGSGDDDIYSGLVGAGVSNIGSQSNVIDGGTGHDKVHYAGSSTDYTINPIGNGEYEVLNHDTNTKDIVKNVQELVFEMDNITIPLQGGF